MISSIELGDFLSHSNTKLEFENGVTVFVGSNGAGKSSIIDAITFALFGQHTRKNNKGLIKRGATQGFAKINFSVNNRKFEAVRKIDSKGTLAATFAEVTDGKRTEIAAGERKQFGESMTQEIEKVLGLDFEKLKIASIVQQGELNTIINAKPKEFKELLNAIIGIDKLDVASESMKRVSKEFREKIKQDVGYDDTHIEILLRDMQKYESDVNDAKPKKEQLSLTQEKLKKEINQIRKKIETDAPKIDKIIQLESRKKEISAYAKEAMREIQREIDQNERKIRDCEDCFEHLVSKVDFELKIQKVEKAISDTVKSGQKMANQTIALNEKISLASKLKIKDNKCPVCDSEVEKLNPFFQEEHLRQEITELQKRITLNEEENDMYTQKRKEFLEKLQRSRDTEATLRAHSINNKEDLTRIQNETEAKKQKISPTVNKNMLEMSQIDQHAKMIFDIITKLEIETKGFDEKQFDELKTSANKKQIELSHTDQQMGAIIEKISKGEEQIMVIKKAVSELKIVKEYVTDLNEIQTRVFSRDGPVATSLRSWALNTISAKASEYLTLLNTKIQRVSLSEKTRDISIACHSKSEVLELESLSGGEKVSVALALRLGMASLLGASNLNLMILDEPTTHLDAERKKSLVGVLSQLADISNSESRMQFLIITHDAEIFDDSTVEQIYKFESSEQGSIATAL
jgi:exonuclease SbcC